MDTVLFLLERVVIISFRTAPSGEVTTPILLGILGIFFLEASSKSPSCFSLFFSCRYFSNNSPSPAF
jgi:hypothetical protein